MNFLLNFIQRNLKYIKILVSINLISFYLFQFSTLFLFRPGSLFSMPQIYCLGVIGVTIYLYFEDKKRISSGDERFRGSNLFFRYGLELERRTMPIQVKNEWSAEDSAKLGDSMMYRIQDDFFSSFGENPLNGKQVVSIIGVTDSNRISDSRGFLKISFTGSRGAIISRFLTYQILGKNLVITKLVYLLGIVQWYDMLFYFLISPLTFPFWIFRWLKNEYSIPSVMAADVDNSFEVFDLSAYFVSSGEVVAQAIIHELRENDLYTPELGNSILQILGDFSVNNYNINNTNNSGNQIFGNSGQAVMNQIK